MHTKRHKHERITRVNSKVARDINRSIILNAVRQRQPISRQEISELTRLNKSTVSNIVTTLLEENLLIESPDRAGTIGRNPVNLNVKKGSHFVAAISFDSPCTRVAIVDIDGTIIARDEIWTHTTSPESLVSQCSARLSTLRARLGPHQFHGIGATVAGIVDSAQSQVILAANLGWQNVDLGKILRTHIPEDEVVSIENDAKAAALAEFLLGKHGLVPTNLVFLSLGPGIGAGIVLNGRILSGSSHAAGEVGHMTVVEGGEQCSCGNRGCWELYASERAPVRWFVESNNDLSNSSQPPSLSDVIGAARTGNPKGIGAIRQWAQHIGVGIGDMIDILDPEVIIVGGTITQIWDMASKDVIDAAHNRGKFAKQRTTTILASSLPDNPALLGAAALPIRKVFMDFSIAT